MGRVAVTHHHFEQMVGPSITDRARHAVLQLAGIASSDVGKCDPALSLALGYVSGLLSLLADRVDELEQLLAGR